jgi:hypothetical protein
MIKYYSCPCCGYLTFAEPPPGTFAICPVCWWEDDEVQARDPDYSGGANEVSLRQAQANFRSIGASNPVFIESVRKPLPHEFPEMLTEQ